MKFSIAKRSIFFITFMLSFMLGHAQKKEIAQARQNVKNGTNLVEAETSMRKLLDNPANVNNEKVWLTLFSAVMKQYEQGNEKLYLKQEYDTAKLFVACRKMFEILEDFDSIDSNPARSGSVRPRYRQKHAELLRGYRRNLFSGGNYFIRKQNYDEALAMYDTYIGTAYHPMFAQYQIEKRDKMLPEAAYWAIYCGYKKKDLSSMEKYKTLAEQDAQHHVYVLQYLSELYQATGDTAQYLSTITEGFDLYPQFVYFFPRLIDYYIEHNDYATAESIVDKAMNIDRSNRFYRFAKSTVLLNKGEYEAAIDICDGLIAEDENMPDAYFNAGISYYNLALDKENNLPRNKENHAAIIDLYRRALPYLEKYKQYAPQQQQRWALPLYTIYLNLNMGNEFEEMEKLLKN